MLGNPKTDDFIDVNSVVPYAHRLTLISDELYEVFPFEFHSSNICRLDSWFELNHYEI